MPGFKDFFLVGGTALALKFGHRKSDDLDLFSHLPFQHADLLTELESEFGSDFLLHSNRENFGIFCYISGVKVDIVRHPFQLVAEPDFSDGIRMYSTADIAAMKVNAILGRGKKKDFWDVFELLHSLTMDEIIQFYHKKFPNQQLAIGIPHAMIYFDDAEESEDPVSLKGQTWEGVKKFLQAKVREFLS